jgi:hypothetical protein
MQPVGKSGPLTCFINPARGMAGSSICAQMPSMISPRLCGGMFVAMPTAMPVPPLTRRFGKRGRKNGRLGEALVVVRNEVHGILVHVFHEDAPQVRHARLGITHRRRRVALDRAEVPLPVHEPFAHGPRLRHVNQRRVNHRFAVRVEITAGIAADFRALVVLAPRIQRSAGASHRGCGAARASGRPARLAARAR